MTKNDKLAAAAHYVIARVRPSDLGATKLQKILWFADCAYFARHGRSITGEVVYRRKPNGPCIARLDAVLRSMEQEGCIIERQVPTYIGHPRREFQSLVEPDMAPFTGAEIDILMQVGLEIVGMTAQEVSDLSHDSLWRETAANRDIAIAAGAVRDVGLEDTDREWVQQAFQ